MLLKNKKILIMGIRNKWSIAYGIAKSAYENGAKLIFTYMGEENKDKIEELISEFKGSKAYVLDGASEDEPTAEPEGAGVLCPPQPTKDVIVIAAQSNSAKRFFFIFLTPNLPLRTGLYFN